MLLLCDSYPFSSNVSGQSAVSSIYSVNYIEYADGFEPMAACGNGDRMAACGACGARRMWPRPRQHRHDRTSRQPPSARPSARPGPASWAVTESPVTSTSMPGGRRREPHDRCSRSRTRTLTRRRPSPHPGRLHRRRCRRCRGRSSAAVAVGAARAEEEEEEEPAAR